ncbi:prepilin-type N-terminal cleavage/methylation domain-containing protein [Clostridium perfringens]|nr:prepilin-type N-terminal cleavage/methylation domain-containing protein [Clostridium perfringens]MBI6012670.1 prepilin-type N-terminal cleavage/methylation domain-containing protein [Clostridium perfringens]MDK0814417.1 prepilin-type N-terminal cleavage/methylation domain-containing protein [Clostridium perfringens]
MIMKRNNKKKKGFTLIELIIVIAIIAILAAIAIPNFLSIQRKARVKADIASAKTIYDAASALVAEGEIIADQTYVLEKEKKSDSDSTLADDNIVEKYLQTIPMSQSKSGDVFAVKVTVDKNAVKSGETINTPAEKANITVYLVPKGSNNIPASGAIVIYPTTDASSDYKLN